MTLADSALDPRLTWNVVADVQHLFDFPFMVNALRAGTAVAVVAGVVGWFMVLRRQTFAGHTLALVGFPGAAGAVLIGASAQLGFFAFCVAGALVIGSTPITKTGFSEQPSVIATVQAFALASGFLFVSLHGGSLNRINSLLFGNFLGVTDADVVRVVVAAVVVIAVMVIIARPIVFATVDPDVAAARGVPVRSVSVVYVLLLGVGAAACSQITGALLVFALLVLPAASAHVLTARPVIGVLLSVGLAIAVAWLGLGIAYYSPYPVGFWLTSIAFAIYVAARVATGRTIRPRLRLAW